jgi:hypothetical protein
MTTKLAVELTLLLSSCSPLLLLIPRFDPTRGDSACDDGWRL